MRTLFSAVYLVVVCLMLAYLTQVAAAPVPAPKINIEGWYEWAEGSDVGESMHGYAVIKEAHKAGLFNLTMLTEHGTRWGCVARLDGDKALWVSWEGLDINKYDITIVNGKLHFKHKGTHNETVFQYVRPLNNNKAGRVEKIEAAPEN